MRARSSEIQQKIQTLEAALKPETNTLDTLLQNFAVGIIPEVKKWIEDQFRSAIEINAESVTKKGPDFARQVKADMADLYNGLSGIVVSSLGDQKNWPHHLAVSNSFDGQRAAQEFLEQVFRRAVSAMGRVLGAHDLLGQSSGFAASRSWERIRGDEYRYAYHTGFNAKQFAWARAYLEEKIAFDNKRQTLASLRVDLAKAQALELFD